MTGEFSAAGLAEIAVATLDDIPTIKSLYRDAIAFQAGVGVPKWENLDTSVIVSDISSRRQFKLLVDGEPAGVFSLCTASFLDFELWRDRDPAAALYMNRIIVARSFARRGLFRVMLRAAEEFCRNMGISVLRMDTWADNPDLLGMYQRHGFFSLGVVSTSDDQNLPPQYRGLGRSILEKLLEAPYLKD